MWSVEWTPRTYPTPYNCMNGTGKTPRGDSFHPTLPHPQQRLPDSGSLVSIQQWSLPDAANLSHHGEQEETHRVQPLCVPSHLPGVNRLPLNETHLTQTPLSEIPLSQTHHTISLYGNRHSQGWVVSGIEWG